MTKIKLWVTDIDGTIMNYDRTYTVEMKNLIEKINKSDRKMVLATGRMFMGANYVASMFNLKCPVICYQGAVVRTQEEVLWQSLINVSVAKEIIKYLKEKNIHTHVYNDDVLYIEDDNKEIMHEYCYGRGTTYTVLNSFDDIKLHNVAKILAVILDSDLMQKVKQELQEKYKGVLTIVQSSKIYLEINDLHASKGNALEFLKKYYNLKDDEVIASGDQDNDIDLIKHAGLKVCVGHNSKELSKISEYHIDSVNSNQLVKLIEEKMLCE